METVKDIWSLPERRGYSVVHQHDEGDRCSLTGRWQCRYVPTIWTRLRWALSR